VDTFGEYEIRLLEFASSADDVIGTRAGSTRPAVDSFLREMFDILSRSDDNLLMSYPCAICGRPYTSRLVCKGCGEDRDITADEIRAGMIERFTDDVICELPDGYRVNTDYSAPDIEGPRV
jgi:hypothetical protein